MRVIGITGGVGAGKTEILTYIESNYNARIILADKVANDLKNPGEACYEPLIKLLGQEILQENGMIDKGKMAQIIFHEEEKLKKVNELIHPAVKAYIVEQIAYERQRGRLDYLFIEAALLIEAHYDEIVDELWYIHADSDVRRKRLKAGRNYSDEKITAIMAKQLPKEVFLEKCQFVIDNSKELADSYKQIARRMEE